MSAYTAQYHEYLRHGARRSARVIAPKVLELVRPTSIVDVGCGVGSWLAVFNDLGVESILGVDGDYVDRAMLEIPAARFVTRDLAAPFRLQQRFDLVVSLEVAEHLPARSAEDFVESLAALGDVVLFSAAIPFQEGERHLNEQWPDYWVALFQKRGYAVIDCLRSGVWNHPDVEWWYAQNMLIFGTREAMDRAPGLKRAFEETDSSQIAIVHPRHYLRVMWIQRILMAARDVADHVGQHDVVVVLDQDQFGEWFRTGCRTVPFVEKDGRYGGPPPDDDSAINELERLRACGAGFVAVGWPAFWWLEHYDGLHRHLASNYRRIFANERVILFDVRVDAGQGRPAPPAGSHR